MPPETPVPPFNIIKGMGGCGECTLSEQSGSQDSLVFVGVWKVRKRGADARMYPNVPECTRMYPNVPSFLLRMYPAPSSAVIMPHCCLSKAERHAGDAVQTVRAVTLSRRVAGKAFHTSRDSTSEPRGHLIFRKHAKILASPAAVVLRQPGCRPRTFRTQWNLCATFWIVRTEVRGCWINLAISL